MYMKDTKDTDVYGIRELQRNLSKVIRSVREGRRVIVTDDGAPVALITATSEAVPHEDPVERKLRRLYEKGLIVQIGRIGPSRPPRVWNMGKGWVQDFLEHRR
jgi:prevent-host-death family protein